MKKEYYIDYFRNGTQESLVDILSSFADCEKRSNAINKVLKELYSSKTELVRSSALIEGWDDVELLQELLLITYSYYVVMLEYRNIV